jgi:hypothetical protein
MSHQHTHSACQLFTGPHFDVLNIGILVVIATPKNIADSSFCTQTNKLRGP